MSSLPVPVSPETRTGTDDRATRASLSTPRASEASSVESAAAAGSLDAESRSAAGVGGGDRRRPEQEERVPRLDDVAVDERHPPGDRLAVDARPVPGSQVLEREAVSFAREARVPLGHAPVGDLDRERPHALDEEALGRARGVAPQRHAVDVRERMPGSPGVEARALERHVDVRRDDVVGSLAGPIARVGQRLLRQVRTLHGRVHGCMTTGSHCWASSLP